MLRSRNSLALFILILMSSFRCNKNQVTIKETERLFNEITHEQTEYVIFHSTIDPIEFSRTIPTKAVTDTIRILNSADNIDQLRHNSKASRVFMEVMDTSLVSVVRFWERESKLNDQVQIRSVFFTIRHDSLYVDGEAEFSNQLLTSFYFKECTKRDNTYSGPIYEYLRMFSSNRFFH